MKKVRAYLVTLILVAITLKILLWTIEPAIPYMVALLFIVFVVGSIWYRMTRW